MPAFALRAGMEQNMLLVRLSEQIAKLEDRLLSKTQRWRIRHPGDWCLYAVLGGVAWYFYGILINSVRLGTRQSFQPDSSVSDIWIVNPVLNLIAPFTPTGLGAAAALLMLVLLCSKKVRNWLLGYRTVRDKRGFVRPYVFQCVKRRASIVLTDPKAKLFESMAGYLTDRGYEVRVFNLLDVEHSDHWNPIGEADHDTRLVDALTSDSTIDLKLPWQKPCAYFCILSAQDSTYAFLSSLPRYPLIHPDEGGYDTTGTWGYPPVRCTGGCKTGYI